MADPQEIKLSALPGAGIVGPSDWTYIVQSNGSRKAQVGSIASALLMTVQEIAAATIPGSVTALATTGYAEAGDGGAWPLAVEIPLASTPKPWHVLSNGGMRRWELRCLEINPKMLGAVYDGATDDFLAHRQAIDFCRENKTGYVRLHNGISYISAEIEVDAQITIQGAHSTLFSSGNGTVIKFPKDVNGFRVCRGDTSTSGGLGDDAILSDFEIQCRDSDTQSGSGIVLDARAKLVNISVSNFGLDGVTIDSASGKNANLWSIERCRFTGNRRDGVYINGANSNAGYSIGCNTTQNGRNGLFDSAFLGNVHVGAHSASSGRGYWVKGSDNKAYACILDHFSTADTHPATGANWATYWVEAAASTSYPAAVINRKYYADGGRNYKQDSNSARKAFIGCYSEPGSPRTDYILYPSTIVGGDMLEDLEGSPNWPGVRGVDTVTQVGGVTVEASLGDRDQTNLRAMSFKASDQALTRWRLDYDATAKVWLFRPTNTNANLAFRVIDNGGSSGLPTGTLDFASLGPAIGGKRHHFGTAAPTTGAWARGDIVYNTAPSATGYMGWTCVTAGTPGTWKGFGLIEA